MFRLDNHPAYGGTIWLFNRCHAEKNGTEFWVRNLNVVLVNAIEHDLVTSLRFPAKVVSRDITSIMTAPSCKKVKLLPPKREVIKISKLERLPYRPTFDETIPHKFMHCVPLQ